MLPLRTDEQCFESIFSFRRYQIPILDPGASYFLSESRFSHLCLREINFSPQPGRHQRGKRAQSPERQADAMLRRRLCCCHCHNLCCHKQSLIQTGFFSDTGNGFAVCAQFCFQVSATPNADQLISWPLLVSPRSCLCPCPILRHLLPSGPLTTASPCLPDCYISLCSRCLSPSSLLAFEGRDQLPSEQASPSILSWFVCDTQPAVGLSSGEPEDVSLYDNILSLCNCSVGETYWLTSLAVRFDLRAKHR